MIPFTHVNLAVFTILQIIRKLPGPRSTAIPTHRLYFISEALSYNACVSLKALCYLCPEVPYCLIEQHTGTRREKVIQYTIRDFIGHYLPIVWFLSNNMPRTRPRLTYIFVSLYIKYIWCVLTTNDGTNILDKEHVYNSRCHQQAHGQAHEQSQEQHQSQALTPHIKKNDYIKATFIGDAAAFIPYLIHLYTYKKNIK